jgi:hypothetical protein
MNNLEIVKLFQSYQKRDIAKSFLTFFIFFLLLGAIIVIPVIKIVYIYIPLIEYFLIGVFLYLSLIGVYTVQIFINTLQTYESKQEINMERIKVGFTTTISVITFITVLIIFIILN